eukprot:scaffold147881_cov17-Tisochrysis_lutea.AAC.2
MPSVRSALHQSRTAQNSFTGNVPASDRDRGRVVNSAASSAAEQPGLLLPEGSGRYGRTCWHGPGCESPRGPAHGFALNQGSQSIRGSLGSKTVACGTTDWLFYGAGVLEVVGAGGRGGTREVQPSSSSSLDRGKGGGWSLNAQDSSLGKHSDETQRSSATKRCDAA